MPDRGEAQIDYRAYPLLYVDDEPENLRVFELTFRREFRVVTATSGEEGLEKLMTERFAVVLSDHKMPGMSGVDFLGRVNEIAPETVRMLVTAYGSADTLAHAINDGSIYRYIAKPWQPDEMRIAVKRGIEHYALGRDREALVRELNTVGEVATTINQELSLDRLSDLLITSLTETLKYDGASLLSFDPLKERLRFDRSGPVGAHSGEFLESHAITREKSPRFVGSLARGEACFLDLAECLDYPAEVRGWITEVAGDLLVVPLLGKDELLGALAVDNRSGGAPFDGRDRRLLEGVARQAAIAVQNARLVEDLRSTRQQVLRADRLGTLGTLSAGLAHEINNPLTSIHTFMSLAPAKRDEPDSEFWGDYHRLACSELERIRGLVATMARLGREDGRVIPRSACDLAGIAGEVVTLVAPEADRRNVSLVVNADPATPKLTAIREQLHQLLLNLTLNAVHASPDGSSVKIRISPGGPGGHHEGVTLEVSDMGDGIADEDLERIFDPFFTTKGPDKGTGLGLMICHRIVTEHNGVIEVTSRPGEGACFRVRLPNRTA
ncbi:MAG: response regulator [Deltaproteobacteria bacterium]|nr:response regulator [Deltaproteobacteria bacterium]